MRRKRRAPFRDHARQAGFDSLTLLSVAGAKAFWERQGFRCQPTPDEAGLLASYGEGIDYMVKSLEVHHDLHNR